MNCPICGAKTEVQQAFCVKCGAKLTDSDIPKTLELSQEIHQAVSLIPIATTKEMDAGNQSYDQTPVSDPFYNNEFSVNTTPPYMPVTTPTFNGATGNPSIPKQNNSHGIGFTITAIAIIIIALCVVMRIVFLNGANKEIQPSTITAITNEEHTPVTNDQLYSALLAENLFSNKVWTSNTWASTDGIEFRNIFINNIQNTDTVPNAIERDSIEATATLSNDNFMVTVPIASVFSWYKGTWNLDAARSLDGEAKVTPLRGVEDSCVLNNVPNILSRCSKEIQTSFENTEVSIQNNSTNTSGGTVKLLFVPNEKGYSGTGTIICHFVFANNNWNLDSVDVSNQIISSKLQETKQDSDTSISSTAKTPASKSTKSSSSRSK